MNCSRSKIYFVFDEHRFSGYGGGFGNGKTLAGAIKTYNHCMQKDAFFLVGRRHATDLEDSTQRDFLNLFGQMGKFSPKNKSFKFYKDGQPFSEVIFRHLDDMQSLTNMNLSGFWIDQAEEVSEDAFDFLVGRIRRPIGHREGFITFNMNGHDWIWRRFLKKIGKDGKPLPNASDFFLVTASTLENKENLPEDYVKGLLSQPKEYVKRFVEGSFDVFAGQIFDEFNPHIHVIQPFQIPNTWERFRSIDHGQNNPTSCHWYAVDFDGNIYVYQEYYQEKDVVSNHVKMINEMSNVRTTEGTILQDLYSYTVIDPSTHAKTKEKDGYRFSVADEYLDAGIATIPAQNDVLAGINRVKEYMKIDPERYHPFLKDPDGDSLKGAPRLFIFSNCVNMIEEINQYKWKSYSGTVVGGADRDEIKEAPVKRKDHACFIAGTKILTTNGQKNIEELTLQDRIVTPFGESKILDLSLTGYSNISNYWQFSSTNDHPVLTDCGIVRVDALRYDNYIWKVTLLKQFTFWEYLIAATLTQSAEMTDYILNALLVRLLQAKLLTYTKLSGDIILEKFQKDTKSIIKTDTMTTRLVHLKSLLTNNMLNDIIGDTLRDKKNILKELDHLQKCGMVLRQENSGTVNMGNEFGNPDTPLLETVIIAVEHMLRISLVEAGSVIQTARPENLGSADVYNLATEDGMYFANDVLVSNCDDLRYAIMSRPQSPSLMQQIEPWVFSNPLELARRAQAMGMTVDDLRAARYNRTNIRHSSSGIKHTDGLKSNA